MRDGASRESKASCCELAVSFPHVSEHPRQEVPLSPAPCFKAVFPYQKDVLALPVADLDAASQWYCEHFGMTEIERRDSPPSVILERNGTRMGFAVNGHDASQDGAAILVSNIDALKTEFEAKGVGIANWRIDERDGQRSQVFFVVAPDGLCYYFHEPLPVLRIP